MTNANKRGAKPGNQNAAKDGGKATSILCVRVTPEEKSAWVRAANGVKLAEWVKTQLNAATKKVRCADCGGTIGKDNGPLDGWELEDGRIVCHACCAEDTKKFIQSIITKPQPQ